MAGVLCSCAGPGRPAGARAADAPAAATPAAGRCGLRRADLLGPSAIRRLTLFAGFPRMALPVRSRTTRDFAFERVCLCGQYYGFITDDALSGAFRRENDAAAAKAGYPIKKWPYVPLSGDIVRELGHQVLELYEGLYLFSSAGAAAGFQKVVRANSGSIAAGGVPAGFAVYTAVLGPDVDSWRRLRDVRALTRAAWKRQTRSLTVESRAKDANGRFLAVAALAAVVCLAGCAGTTPGDRAATARKAAAPAAGSGRGGIDPRAMGCVGQGPVIGDVGLLSATSATAKRLPAGLGARPQIRTARGTLVLFRPASAAAGTGPVASFATRGAVRAQSSIAAPHSCDMLLSDRPAARPVISAAERATVSAGAAASAARLRSSLQEVLISDDPISPGSIIVTLLLPGPAYSSGVPGAAGAL